MTEEGCNAPSQDQAHTPTPPSKQRRKPGEAKIKAQDTAGQVAASILIYCKHTTTAHLPLGT